MTVDIKKFKLDKAKDPGAQFQVLTAMPTVDYIMTEKEDDDICYLQEVEKATYRYVTAPADVQAGMAQLSLHMAVICNYVKETNIVSLGNLLPDMQHMIGYANIESMAIGIEAGLLDDHFNDLFIPGAGFAVEEKDSIINKLDVIKNIHCTGFVIGGSGDYVGVVLLGHANVYGKVMNLTTPFIRMIPDENDENPYKYIEELDNMVNSICDAVGYFVANPASWREADLFNQGEKAPGGQADGQISAF